MINSNPFLGITRVYSIYNAFFGDKRMAEN
jgi:hypothetical protein